MKKKFTIKKFMGDDSYSWAVFRAEDVKGMRSPICDPWIQPVMSGLTRADARYHKMTLEAK
jgi:hypothetical protein